MIAVASAAGADEFPVGRNLEEGAVGEVGAMAVDFEGEVVSSKAAMTVGPVATPDARCGAWDAQVRA